MFDGFIELVEKEFESFVKAPKSDISSVFDAAKYSFTAGGKRIRPCLLLEFSRICGGEIKNSVKFASALEMIHTYSLIHDDLPAMDNDDMRRGKPSCHKAFGEATAILTGDALLTDAFTLALSTEGIPSERVIRAASVLSGMAGSKGMIGGQVIDLKYENKSVPLDSIITMYLLKTGCLLKAACTIGCILAGASEEKINAAGIFADNIGIAFQIKDDILDITSTGEVLGKPVGSDENSMKSTYVSHVGLENAEADVLKYTEIAVSALSVFGDEADDLRKFAFSLCERKK